ncbi:YjbQ family protein [Bacillus sp. S3]|uniref:secondary thiamine-phosphate synthase enzyme YjbQ n=1 Tax=Bacillus sp. S3 TaxID=486398 RepID=UPI00118819B4|nr:secondary thiamine-phosphate synthase enzyme YjbQ [Bacillus sp. S3]QCJ44720.1 YjbQ family protein [Bacillus sp. S3]
MIKHKLHTDTHGVLDITRTVESYVKQSNVQTGLCCVYVPHTTAALTIYSGVDPLGLMDLNDAVKSLVPTRTDFHHQCDTPTDAAGHIKASLIGPSITFVIEEGKLMLGNSQSIYFFEFDGPRDREIYIQAIGTN